MYHDLASKKQWAKSLKAGDIVEDCNYKHRTIVEIKHRIEHPYWVQDMLEWLAGNSFLKKWIGKPLHKAIPRTNYIDATLIFEDGSQCSAVNCCDPIE